MKRIIFSFILLSMAGSVSAINGFGIDGNLGVGLNGDEMVYIPSLEGRIQLNEYFSTSLGIGILNSGVKDEWTDETETSTTFTSFRLGSNKTTPTLHLSLRGQFPLIKVYGRQVYLYAEPKLIYIPFSGRQLNLYEFNFKKEINATTGETTYSQYSDPEYYNITSPSHQNLYGSLSGGVSVKLKENVELALGYGYTNIDVFKYVRDEDINGTELKNHLPGSGIQFINIGIRVNYNVE